LNEGDTIPRFSTIQVNSPLSIKNRPNNIIYTKRPSSILKSKLPGKTWSMSLISLLLLLDPYLLNIAFTIQHL